MRFKLNLTHDCNLSCRYCYGGRKLKKDMSFATAQNIVDWAMAVAPRAQKTTIGFFGGEPLLRFDLLEDIVGYVRDKERETRKRVALAVSCNGTLLTRSILDFFRDEGVELCISIDGPPHVHNLNRCYGDGSDSFQDVERNLRLAIDRLGILQVNAVYGPDTVEYLPETMSFFAGLGVGGILVNPNVTACWGDDAHRKVRESFALTADNYIRSYEDGHEIGVNLIDTKIILLLKGGYEHTDKCLMGEKMWSFAPSGNIYPCARLVGEDNNSFCLGSIHTRVDPARVSSLLEHRGNHNDECRTCDWQRYCMNWCACTNYHMTGHTDLAAPILCEVERAAIRAGQHVLVSLKDNQLFLNHFLKYLHERH